MRQVKIDEAMSTILGSLTERAQLVDTNGTLLGHFVPVEVVYRLAETHLDPEEFRACRLPDGEWKFTDEMIDRLLTASGT